MQVDRAEFAKVPYLDRDAIGARLVNLMPFWDGTKWHLWFPGPEGLIHMNPMDTVHADYVAKVPARDSDLFVPFVDFMWQRASWPDVSPLISAICEDFHNLSTSVAKLRHFHQTRGMLGTRISSFAATEIEYITIVAEGIFDRLQEAISLIWDRRVRLLEEVAEKRRRRHKLPKTFSKIVLNNKQSRKDVKQIGAEYCFPPVLAAEYVAHAPFFSDLRNVRHKVVHGLGSLPTVFCTERGFCIDPESPPYNSFVEWDQQHRYNDKLVSILPWLAHVILHTVEACSALMSAFAKQIELPAEIAPCYRVFVRGINSDVRGGLIRCHRGELVWWGELPDESGQPVAPIPNS